MIPYKELFAVKKTPTHVSNIFDVKMLKKIILKAKRFIYINQGFVYVLKPLKSKSDSELLIKSVLDLRNILRMNLFVQFFKKEREKEKLELEVFELNDAENSKIKKKQYFVEKRNEFILEFRNEMKKIGKTLKIEQKN